MITNKGIVYCKFCGGEVSQKKKGPVKRYCNEVCKSRFFHEGNDSKASKMAAFLKWAIDKKVSLMPGGGIQLAYDGDTYQSVANEYLMIVKGKKAAMLRKREEAKLVEQPKRVIGAAEPVRQAGEGAMSFAIRRQEWEKQQLEEKELFQDV